MEGIYNATDEFPFSKLLLLKPTAVAGGNYFIKFRINELPLYIQTPKCNTKQGILKAGKKYFSDLMFTNEHESFIQWIEKLENYSQKYIYDHRETWFDTELDLHDIENSFSSCVKLYKSGKYYIVRTHVPTQLGKCSLKIYNENEELVDPEEITDKNDVVTILEFQGIKCSARSFQIEIEIKQMLVLPNTNLFEKCILVKGKHKSEHTNTNEYLGKPQETTIGFNTFDDASETRLRSSAAQSEGLSHIFSSNANENVPILQNDNLTDYANNSGSKAAGVRENSVERSSKEFEQDKPSFSETIEMFIKTNHNINDELAVPEDIEPLEDDSEESSTELREIELSLDEIPETEQIQIKTRNDVYYKMYQDAKKKAKLAKDLALSAYLEAKHIKNTYMLEDLDDSDSDLDEDSFYEKPE
jgi:hypothetical protein